MEKYSVVYIDDSPESALTKYLDTQFHNDNYEIECHEVIFDPTTQGYDSLLQNTTITSANVIFIDSRLFENRNALSGKFTGEEFKLVLKKFFPFIEVIVITQNGTEDSIEKIPKYDKSSGKTASEYYDTILPKYLDSAIESIRQYRSLANLVESNNSWEKLLKEKVLATLNGSNSYDELTKTDIDTLIEAFKEIQVSLDE